MDGHTRRPFNIKIMLYQHDNNYSLRKVRSQEKKTGIVAENCYYSCCINMNLT
jgi:hypothetical protein